MKRRYIVHPGFVVSRTDGDQHYIGYSQLIALYKVDPTLCILYKEGEYIPRALDAHLYPKYSGDYSLP